MPVSEKNVLDVYKRQYGTDVYNSFDPRFKNIFEGAVNQRGSKASPAEISAFANALAEEQRTHRGGLLSGFKSRNEFLAGGFITAPRAPSGLDPRVVQARRRGLARQFRQGAGRGAGGGGLSLLGSAGGVAAPTLLGL